MYIYISGCGRPRAGGSEAISPCDQSRTHHWELIAPGFRPVIAATNASFLGDFGLSGTGVKIDPENEASLSAIRAQNEGRPEWRWNVHNSPMIFRESWANHWELTVPDFRTLIAAKSASFFGHFRRPDTGVEMAPKMRHTWPRLGPRRGTL